MKNEIETAETLENEADYVSPRPAHAGLKRIGQVAFALVAIVAIIVGVRYYLISMAHESTDDAFLEGDIVQISSRVAGQVTKVYVEDNQHVKRGDLLLEIDSRDYEARLSEAQARLEDLQARESGAQSNLDLTTNVTDAAIVQADASLGATEEQEKILAARLEQDKANILAAEADLEQAGARRTGAEAEAARAAADVVRYRTLHQKDEVSRQTLDRSEAEARSTAANSDAAKHMVLAAQARLTQARAAYSSTEGLLRQARMQIRQAKGKVMEAHSAPSQRRVRQSEVQVAKAQIQQQRAAVQQAELNHSYTRVYAIEDGYITRKSVEAGNFIQPGQSLMALVSEKLWVLANFKETQLASMRVGQPALIKVDAYPGRKFRGHVDSFQSGSGARFSLLPPENATGNYVKVIQRVPVKIVFDEPLPEDFRLGPGMSVEPEVRVR